MRTIRRRTPVVSTPKTKTAIPVPDTVRRDLVIQTALDPHVRSIQFMHQVVHGGRAVTVGSIIVHRDDGDYMMEVVGPSPLRTPADDETVDRGLTARGIRRREIAREDIRSEPRFGNARRIWECRNDRHSARDRHRILETLGERGPQTVGELDRLVVTESGALSVVCTLACENALELDIDNHQLGPKTLVRPRR
ncbi:hypothetical protein [Bradyrhizobium sp. CCBAU 53338]|uniref:hypothetical protein n=1 Tax=Bradyrhizobium sp. CCBAU 53338 TaxID=1325111 RepID=UPI00188D9B82|nr:hypothetical protein [Bradyrhizobium sp. CCBAU 53338]QOZ51577.1 hypothetical protein XH90_09420 [Bradyrhizobium sp. CCBAU 53338]